MQLPTLSEDRANHFTYGAAICALVSAFFGREVGLVATCVAAIGKELFDGYRNWKVSGDPRIGPHGFSVGDGIATVAGGLCVYMGGAVPAINQPASTSPTVAA